jgi:TRAP-type C4-dicarboxylate transport system permease large subunit
MSYCKSCKGRCMLLAPRRNLSPYAWVCTIVYITTVHKYYIHITMSGIIAILCPTICSFFFPFSVPNKHTNSSFSTLRQTLLLTHLFWYLLLRVFVYVLIVQTLFFVTYKMKATQHKCFIFTVLVAKSCTVKQIRQMADLNVKDRKKCMKKS